MAAQIETEFKSENGTEYKVELFNDSFFSSVHVVTNVECNVDYESQGDPIMEPLKASRCTWKFLNNNSLVDDLITGLVNGSETQFRMVVSKGGNLFWVGNVIVDEFSFEDMPKRRVVTITAIDGIGRLADIPFDFATDGTKPVQNTLLKYIFEALEYNDLSQHWGFNDIYFRESSEIYETQMTTTGTSFSPFLLTRCDRQLFVTFEEKFTISGGVTRTATGNLPIIPFTLFDAEPISCAKVLEHILRQMECRMFISDGSYYIQQIRNFATATYNERAIKKDLTVLAFSSVSHRKTELVDLKRVAGGTFPYFPPLQEVIILDVPRVGVAQSGGRALMETGNNPIVQTVQLGTLRGGVGSGKTIRVTMNIRWISSSLVTGGMDIEAKLSAGTSRLKSTQTRPDKVQWTTTASDVVSRAIQLKDIVNRKGIMSLEFTSDEFPLTTQTGCVLEITYTGIGLSGSDAKIAILPVNVELLEDGDLIKEEIYKVTNPTTDNSVIIDYGQLFFTDNAIFSSKNAFEVFDATNWLQSNVWDAGYTTDEPLSKTLALETMSHQHDGVETIQSTLKVHYSLGMEPVFFHKSYFYDSNTYIINGGTQSLTKDAFNGVWFKFIQNQSGLAVAATTGAGDQYRGSYGRDAKEKGKLHDKPKFTEDYVLAQTLATVSTSASGTITSISCTALSKAIKDNDQISILHPVTLFEIDTLVVNGDTAASATSITVDSITVADTLAIGYVIIHLPAKLVETGKLRSTELRIVNQTTPTAATNIDGDGSMRVDGSGFFYVEMGGTTYKFTGVALI